MERIAGRVSGAKASQRGVVAVETVAGKPSTLSAEQSGKRIYFSGYDLL